MAIVPSKTFADTPPAGTVEWHVLCAQLAHVISLNLPLCLAAVFKEFRKKKLTSCRRPAATICLRPLQVHNIFVFIRQVAPIPACWLFKTSATSWPFPFDLESGVRVACGVGYLCANFSVPRTVFELGPMYAIDRRPSDRQTSDKSIA